MNNLIWNTKKLQWVDPNTEFKEQVIEYALAKQFILGLNPEQFERYFQDNWFNRPHAPGWDTTPKHSDADIVRMLYQVTQRYIVHNQALGRK